MLTSGGEDATSTADLSAPCASSSAASPPDLTDQSTNTDQVGLTDKTTSTGAAGARPQHGRLYQHLLGLQNLRQV